MTAVAPPLSLRERHAAGTPDQIIEVAWRLLVNHPQELRGSIGRLQDARRMSAVLVEIAQQSGRRERAGLFEAGRAVWEAFYGNAAAARQSASKALALGRDRNVDYAAAFALALSGELRQARDLAQDLTRELPEDTFVQFMYLPTLRALFALNARDPVAAIQALQVASRYDLHTVGVSYTGRVVTMWSTMCLASRATPPNSAELSE